MIRDKLLQALQNLRRAVGIQEFNVSRRFSTVYEKNLFSGAESRSGIGSSIGQTAHLRKELPELLRTLGVTRLLDAPCGDCHWISTLDWKNIEYIGADVVPALIADNRAKFRGSTMTFVEANLCECPLPFADLIFCRDCWVHLTFRQISACLANFQRSGATYLLTTTFPALRENNDLGQVIWRPLNLQLAPFAFSDPLQTLVEGCTEDSGKYADKALGLWRLADLKIPST